MTCLSFPGRAQVNDNLEDHNDKKNGKGPILIVDDSPDIREALADFFKDEGYDVLVASNGLEAMSVLRSSPAPRMILLDVMMPIMDGHEFIEQQEKDPALADIPVVVITAGRFEKRRPNLRVARKPFELTELLSFAREAC